MLKALRRRKFHRKFAPFFDAEYYVRQNPDVAAAGVDPLRHYLDHGWREGRNPSNDFDSRFYLQSYPDVAASGVNPLVHYVEFGRFENRVAHPTRTPRGAPPPGRADHGSAASARALVAAHMDRAFYLQTYHDVERAGLDPVDHYLNHGWAEGRNPTRDFCSAFYLDEYPDVRHGGMNPFVHYLKWGRAEGRRTSSPILDRIALKPVESAWKKQGKLNNKYDLSVVVPTYNRAHMLPALLSSWRAAHARTQYSYEIIFSDDGSSDETLSILEAVTDLPVTLVRNEHGGAAKARNAAVRAAQGEIILFLGDDIFPDPWLINRHVEKHRQLPDTDAVLGYCDWHPDLNVNYLMRHITEVGCEQFSFPHFPVHGYTDFRHFYTCNISIDREFLLSEDVIFDEAFYKVNFEDIELGYRLAQKGMRVYYYPEAYGDHYHPYNDVGRFCQRQEIAGEMAIVFRRLHPEVTHLIPLRAMEERWAPYIGEGPAVFDFYGTIVGLCQEAENRSDELDDEARENLSRVYSMIFRFAFEYGYCRHKLEGVTPDVGNRALHGEFFDLSCRKALAVVSSRLKLKDHDVFAAALKEYQRFTPAPSTAPAKHFPAAPDMGSRSSGVAAIAPESAAAQVRPLLIIVGQNWAHLNALRETYRDHQSSVAFALASEMAFDGMVYAPQPGTEISPITLKELLLFIEMNPAIGKVVLSHGLYDLPKIGVRKSGKPDIVQRRGESPRGKVIRVFGGGDTQACALDQVFGAGVKSHDGNGYLHF